MRNGRLIEKKSEGCHAFWDRKKTQAQWTLRSAPRLQNHRTCKAVKHSDNARRRQTRRNGKTGVNRGKMETFLGEVFEFFADENLDALTIAQTIVSKNEAQAKFNFN